jgi:hypothetical protein
MKCRCPACGAAFSLDVLIAHEEARGLIVELMNFSLPFGSLVIRYLALFRPEKQELRMERVAKLMRELLPDVKRGAITRKGREWPLGKLDWQGALEAVLSAHDKGSLTLPLQDHAYLYEVLMRHADKQEARAEQATEQQRRRDAQSRNPANAAQAVPATNMDKGFTSVDQLLAEGKRRRAADAQE